MNKYNYFVNSKNSRLINGHLPSESLYNKILEHDGSTAYCCYFDLDFNYLKLEWDTGKKDDNGKPIYKYLLSGVSPKNPDWKCNGKTFTQYEGVAAPALNMVSFDFDSEDPQQSLDDVRKFVEWINADDIAVFFSGSKGFHVMVPFGYFGLEASEHLPKQLKDLAKHLKESYPTMDDSIYNYNRKFRVPFTKHEKSGLYKTFMNCGPDSVLFKYGIEHLKKLCTYRMDYDFLNQIKPYEEREPKPQIRLALDESKRKSYEVEKHKGGTTVNATNFEKFDNKLCIQKMLTSTCNDIGRNNACIRIVNDFYRQGMPQAVCENKIAQWCSNNELSITEATGIINNIYNERQIYNFGCQDELKSSYCSDECSIYSLLSPDKRPQVISTVKKLKSEFEGVEYLMQALFGSEWDASTQSFSLGHVIKAGKEDLFYYKDNYWQHLEENKIDIIKQKLNAKYGNKLGKRKLDSIYKMLVMYAPAQPDGVDMFSPPDNMVNFLDGTLMLTESNQEFKFIFKPHSKEDYLTTMVQAKYRDFERNQDLRNDKFEDWLMTYLENDADSYKLVQEMFGASLLPRFPQFFVLLGESGTGKSTCMKILLKMHENAKYIGRLSPHEFNKFRLKSLINKRVNVVMDIRTDVTISDDVVKQVADRVPLLVERKSLDDVEAVMPAIHIFGANKMPTTLEGYSGAMKRRFTIVNFDKVHTGKVFDGIADYLFNHSPQGVFNFALKGLLRLVNDNQGKYTQTRKSLENQEKWTSRSDVIKRFIMSFEEDGVKDVDGEPKKVIESEGLEIKKSYLWKLFKEWQLEAIEQRNQLGRNKFYDLMDERGFKFTHRESGDFYLGIGLEATQYEDNEI